MLARVEDAGRGATRGGRVTVFGPSPVLRVVVDRDRSGAGDVVRLDPAGQGVWVSRAALLVGAQVTLCGLVGGDVGRAVAALVTDTGPDVVLLPSTGTAGCYVVDRRTTSPGADRPVAASWAPPPSREEVDALVAATCAAAATSDVLVVGNPMPGDALPADVYRALVRAGRRAGCLVVVDLSRPRLDSALTGGPDVVKVNDWELAEYVAGPVEHDRDRQEAMTRLRVGGARSVVVTRGARDLHGIGPDGTSVRVTPPTTRGDSPAGCGDALTGAMAGALACGASWTDALRSGVAAGAASYRLGDLDMQARPVLDEMLAQVRVEAVTG